MSKTILYFVDPMCSWCWGFAPVMEKVRAQIGDKAEIQVFVGGLRPFTEQAMTDKDKSYVRNHCLGYSSCMIIHKLIKEGHLQTYTFPDSPKKLVDKNDVLNLIQPSDQEEADKTS